MITEKEIQNLRYYAGNLLKDRQDIDPEDTVQDALLILFELGKDFNFSDAKAKVKDRAFRSKLIENRKEEKTFADSETTKHCKGCNEDILINGFYIFRNHKKNITSLSHLCKSCHKKYTYSIAKQPKNKVARREKYNAYHRAYHQKKRLAKEFAAHAHLKLAHALLEWRKSA